ncbi:HD domain-containing protein [Patescibacteria group bacterium]|nr:HD domain-containing protein [Patescibacteria group bacterium]
MLTFQQIKENKQIHEFIRRSAIYLKEIDYNDHGFRHVGIVSDRAGKIARTLKFNKQATESVKIAGYCHDMGNFLGRSFHHYWGAMLFHQLFGGESSIGQTADIMQAIVAHDKEEVKIMNKIAAVIIIADKSDVHRSRVLSKKIDKIRADIHDRVNYAVVDNHLILDSKKKIIKLSLTIDQKFVEVMDYFEIFTQRMIYCRSSVKYLGYKFSLEINKFKLS